MKVFEAINETNKILDTVSYRIGLLNCIQDDPSRKQIYQRLLDTFDCATSDRELTPSEEKIFCEFVATKFGFEVEYNECLIGGLTPMEALKEWDLI
jgi:hypothetical protein